MLLFVFVYILLLYDHPYFAHLLINLSISKKHNKKSVKLNSFPLSEAFGVALCNKKWVKSTLAAWASNISFCIIPSKIAKLSEIRNLLMLFLIMLYQTFSFCLFFLYFIAANITNILNHQIKTDFFQSIKLLCLFVLYLLHHLIPFNHLNHQLIQHH